MSKPLKVSPSQIDSYIMCPRKWWLRSLKKIYGPRKSVTLLGDIGHAVIERFLQGKTGDALYPEGWEYEVNRWTGKRTGNKIPKAEQALVKALIHNGIKQGTIAVAPDGETEKEFTLTLDTETPISINMFLDYLTGESVDDHKFCGSTRWYSADKLRRALPMNLYATACYILGHFPEDMETVWLRYNLFVKDKNKPTTKRVEVEVKQEDLKAHFENIVVPNCQKMAKLAERDVGADDWSKVAGAEDKREGCQAYGGCEYLDICAGKVTVEEFRARQHAKPKDEEKKRDAAMKRLKAGNVVPKSKAVETEAKVEGGKKKMSFLENLKKNQSGGTAAPAKAETPAKEPEKTEAPAKVVATGEKAPWYFEGCKVCSSFPIPGFNKEVNKPCVMCNVMSKKEKGHALVADFQLDVQEDGSIVVSLEGEEVLTTGAVAVKTAPDVVEPTPEPEKKEEPTPEPTPEPEPEPEKKEEPAPAPAPVPETAEDPLPLAQGEFSAEGFEMERKGFVISYVPVRSRKRGSKKIKESNCVIQVAELCQIVAANLLEVVNAGGGNCENYYQIPHNSRIDLIRSNAEAIAALLGKSVLDASTALRGSDEQYICAAIERYADWVFGGIA
jgi:hypothetical protein